MGNAAPKFEAYQVDEPTTEVVPVTPAAVPAVYQNVGGAFEENLGDEGISLKDLDRVKTPSGGGTTWTIPTIDGEIETKQFDGIILDTKLARAYWEKEFSGGSVPPDCSSENMKMGHGNPGGPCDPCPMNVFGTDKEGKGRGKACKEMRVMFVLREDEIMPLVLVVKPGSLKYAKKYLLSLSMKGRRMHEVVTRMTLKKEKNKDGIDFSMVQFEDLGPVKNPQEMATRVATFKTLIGGRSATEFVDSEGAE